MSKEKFGVLLAKICIERKKIEKLTIANVSNDVYWYQQQRIETLEEKLKLEISKVSQSGREKVLSDRVKELESFYKELKATHYVNLDKIKLLEKPNKDFQEQNIILVDRHVDDLRVIAELEKEEHELIAKYENLVTEFKISNDTFEKENKKLVEKHKLEQELCEEVKISYDGEFTKVQILTEKNNNLKEECDIIFDLNKKLEKENNCLEKEADHFIKSCKELQKENKPLDRFMDNVDAVKLGEITYNADMELCGDFIDKGLILRRMLEEKGFVLIKKDKEIKK
ncbi:MAG: hypothetical protein ACTSRG_12910 [Candidatus Helarchaeota archaeon]